MKEKTGSEEQFANFLKPVLVLERFSVAFREKTEVNKTQLQLQSKLRWNLFNNYLHLLVTKEFLQHRKDDRVELYSLTEQGRNFSTSLRSSLTV